MKTITNSSAVDNNKAILSTVIALEDALNDFMALSINNSEPFGARRKGSLTFGVEPANKEMRRNRRSPRTLPVLRFRPYAIPQSIALALRHYLSSRQNSPSIPSISGPNSSPFNEIQLSGCDFHGKALAENGTGSKREEGSKWRSRPCWLQHRQSQYRSEAEWQEQRKKNSLSNNGGHQGNQQQQQQDPVIGELSDYFQHFVCLCSPKMSDQAQSMYA